MPGHNYLLSTETVTFGENTIELRGLSLPHIWAVVKRFEALADKLYLDAISGRLEANTQAIVMAMGEDMPGVLGMLIGFAAGKPEDAEFFGTKLPLGAQLDAVDKIAALTLESVGSAEKFMEIIIKALTAIQKAQLRPVSANGSLVSTVN